VYVLVLDDLHTDPQRTNLLKAAARRFIEEYFFPGDQAAVVFTGTNEGRGQELTSSRRLLLASIDRFQGQQIDSAESGRLETFQVQQAQQPEENTQSNSSAVLADPNDAERRFNARRSLTVLRDAAAWMGNIPLRRKSILFFSEGIGYDITNVFNTRGSDSVLPGSMGVLFDARDSVASATRGNVSIYSIDPRGLGGLSDDFIELSQPQNATSQQREQLGTHGIQNDLRIAQDNLRMLAEETGGLAMVNSNDFSAGFDRIVQDNSTYYVLGYYTRPDAKAGKYHQIGVKLRRPGLHVRSRRGYVPSDAKDQTSKSTVSSDGSSLLLDALASPIASGNLPMSLFAAPFKGNGKDVSVMIAAEIPGQSLVFQQRGETAVDNLSFSVLAAGPDRRVAGTDAGGISLSVKPEVRQQIARTGVRFLSRISLPPARYQLRVAARESGGNAVSVVHYDLDVPDFTKEPLAMSGLVITSSSAAAMATAGGDSQLRAALPFPPTAVRTFGSTDVIVLYAEIYGNMQQIARGLDVATTIQEGNREVSLFSSQRELSTDLSASTTTLPYGIEIPLEGIRAGDYVLRVEAQSRDGKEIVFREVPFTVR